MSAQHDDLCRKVRTFALRVHSLATWLEDVAHDFEAPPAPAEPSKDGVYVHEGMQLQLAGITVTVRPWPGDYRQTQSEPRLIAIWWSDGEPGLVQVRRGLTYAGKEVLGYESRCEGPR